MAAGADFALELVWDNRHILSNMKRGGKALEREIDQRLQFQAPRLEAFMKTTAPWTDQTGNARNGLAARAYNTGSEQGIILYHQVPYGVYLELKNDGKFAIIIPTLEAVGPDVMASIDRLLERMQF